MLPTFPLSPSARRSLAAALFSLSLAAGAAEPQDASKKPFLGQAAWLADYEQLKQHVTDVYPNLDARKVDLPALDERTRDALAKATTDLEAAGALGAFVREFHDPHLRLVRPGAADAHAEGSASPLARSADGKAACAALGAKARSGAFSFSTPAELGFAPVDDSTGFALTTLSTGGVTLGFVRLASFLELAYPAACERAWPKYAAPLKSDCDEACQSRFLVELQNQLIADFEQALRKLRASGVQGLVVDLTGNGGGSSWVEPITRMLTAKKLACGQFGFIRHPHWTKQFEEQLADVEAERANTPDPTDRLKLLLRIRVLRQNRFASKERCDRSALWSRTAAPPTCSLVVKQADDDCEPDASYRFTRGVYDGPLFLLVDGKSASATEELAGRHHDNGTAVLLGERTAGAGCGYTNGGIPLTLRSSGIGVRVPDCARYLRDGTNEVNGIPVDVELPIAKRGSVDFTKALTAAVLERIRPKDAAAPRH